MMMLAAALGSGVGAICRYLLDWSVTARWPHAFPLGTWLVNVCGSFLAGLLTALVQGGRLDATTLTITASGFIGGYTTFSAFAFETVRLGQDGRVRMALTNVVASVLTGLAAAAAGLALGSA